MISKKHHGRILDTLIQSDLFSGNSREELETLAPYFTRQRYESGDTVLEECSPERTILLFLSGSVGIYKSSEGCSAEEPEGPGGNESSFLIASLGPGEVLGEMSFLEAGQGRSASVRALESCELLALSYGEFSRFQNKNSRAGFFIVSRLASRISQRLRALNQEKVEQLEHQLEESRSRTMMARMISYVILLLFGYNLSLQITMELSRQTFYANSISFAIVAIFGIMLLVLARSTGYGWEEYGLSTKGWRASLGESAVWSLAVMAVLTIVKIVLIAAVPRYADLPLFGPFDGTSWLLPALFYTLLSPVQEFIARGVLQSSFERFYGEKNRVFLSILISNALFSAAHVHLSSLFAATVFIPGFLWGYLYHRHRTIIGVSFSHIVIGLYAVYVLRFVMMANM